MLSRAECPAYSNASDVSTTFAVFEAGGLKQRLICTLPIHDVDLCCELCCFVVASETIVNQTECGKVWSAAWVTAIC